MISIFAEYLCTKYEVEDTHKNGGVTCGTYVEHLVRCLGMRFSLCLSLHSLFQRRLDKIWDRERREIHNTAESKKREEREPKRTMSCPSAKFGRLFFGSYNSM